MQGPLIERVILSESLTRSCFYILNTTREKWFKCPEGRAEKHLYLFLIMKIHGRVLFLLLSMPVFLSTPASAASFVEEVNGKSSTSTSLEASRDKFKNAAAQTQAVYQAQSKADYDKLDAMVKLMGVWGADIAAKFPSTWLKKKQDSTTKGYVDQLREWHSEDLATGVPGMNPSESEIIRQILALVGGDSGLSEDKKRELLLIIEKYMASGIAKGNAKALELDIQGSTPDSELQALVTKLSTFAKSSGGAVPSDLGSRIASMLQTYHDSHSGSDLSYLTSIQRPSSPASVTAATAESKGLVAELSDTASAAVNRGLEAGFKSRSRTGIAGSRFCGHTFDRIGWRDSRYNCRRNRRRRLLRWRTHRWSAGLCIGYVGQCRIVSDPRCNG